MCFDLNILLLYHFSHEKWSTAVKCIAVLDVLMSITTFSQQCGGIRPEIKMPSSKVNKINLLDDKIKKIVICHNIVKFYS